MPRFFVATEDIQGNTAKITGEDCAHITKVLRMNVGDEIILSDCLGKDYQGEIVQLSVSEIMVRIISVSKCLAEPGVNVTLYQGLPKGDKMDSIIQKCVELGIHEIVPVTTHRTVVKIGDKKAEEKKLTRWNRIAYEAAKQSGRGIIPKVKAIIPFEKAAEQASQYDMAFIPYEKALFDNGSSLSVLLEEAKNQRPQRICFYIGPEGGFEEREISFGLSHKIHPISLGRRILRTETAGSAFLSVIMFALGEMN